MNDNESKLPVIVEEICNSEKQSSVDEGYRSEGFYVDEWKAYTKTKRSQNRTILYHAFAIALSLLALFSFFLCVFSDPSSLISSERIISYIATDFLGIDLDSSKNIYEMLMSGSFGATSTDTEKSENVSSDNASPPENGSVNTQAPTNESTNNGNVTLPPVSDPPRDNEQKIPEGEYAILEIDLSKQSPTVSNQTSYNIDVNEMISSDKTILPYKSEASDLTNQAPLVLIIHTHGTEAYTDEGRISYSEKNDTARSNDVTKNVVSIGAEMAKILNESGIPTLHCPIMHDKDSYKNSYQRAAETIEEYLNKYPSIRYVFDVHRDSIVSESKTKYKPITIIDNTPTAQIMFVIGTDEASVGHTEWRSNLTFALKLTDRINSSYESMVRPTSLRASDYNQQYTTGSILIEIGSCANTLEEAKSAARITALCISSMISEGW